jgi:hypothetical protein
MRQAIAEGFIMDVLKNYITYQTFYRLLKACEDDLNVERKKAARALSHYYLSRCRSYRFLQYIFCTQTAVKSSRSQNYECTARQSGC